MTESDLVTHLKANTALTALISGRIYPIAAPQNVAKPYLVYRVISNNSNQCLEGGIYENDVRIQIDIWADTYSNAKVTKEAAVDAILGFKSSYNINVMDDYEQDTLLYRQILDFKLKG